jgi:hypothetical protein
MNITHKGHRILVSASRLAIARQWKLCLTIIWNEDGKGIVSKLTVNRTFRLREEAEMDGLRFAKKWIDDGKPDLSLLPNADRSSQVTIPPNVLARAGREDTLDIGK